ncbi:MAG TPA: 4'-phosphopantetheinyl transferase superfamily protein, partial [Verrucomicrobiae bacterium]
MKLIPQEWKWDSAAASGALPGPHDPAVWIARLPSDVAIQSHLQSLLSSTERAQLERFQVRQDQLRFLAGRGLLRIFLGAHLKVPAPAVELHYTSAGKPFVSVPKGAPQLHFNVSHSGEWVAIALSFRTEVGVDLEVVRPSDDLETVARQVFPPTALRAWLQSDSANSLTAFYQAWTRHEAALKALGQGFAPTGDVTVSNVECRD